MAATTLCEASLLLAAICLQPPTVWRCYACLSTLVTNMSISILTPGRSLPLLHGCTAQLNWLEPFTALCYVSILFKCLYLCILFDIPILLAIITNWHLVIALPLMPQNNIFFLSSYSYSHIMGTKVLFFSIIGGPADGSTTCSDAWVKEPLKTFLSHWLLIQY